MQKKACFSIRDPWGGKLARKVILKKACFSIKKHALVYLLKS